MSKQPRSANGRFVAIKKDAPKVSPLKQAGESGLKRSHGYIYEEFLNELTGESGVRVLKEMSENDPIVGAMLFAIEYFMRQVKWFVDAPPKDPDGLKKKQFVEECKDDMGIPWSDFIAEVMSMLPYGWSYFEILYKRRTTEPKKDTNEPQSKFNDKRIGWKRFDIRSQDSLDHWEFDDETGALLGLWQRPAPDYSLRFIPLQKALHFKTTSRKGNPEGRSVLRNAYRPWYFKKRIEEIEGVGIERDLAGLPMAEVPADMLREDASDSDKEMIAGIIDLLKNVRRDEQEGVIWPQQYGPNGEKMYEFKLMNSGGQRAFSTNDTITRYESRMAMTVLVDFILLGNDSQGSFAMATSKTGLFQSVLTVWLTAIQDVLNNYAVPRLFRINGVDGPYPTFRADDVQKPSIADLATFIAALAGAGAQLFPDVELENYLRRVALLPQREHEEKDTEEEDELRDEKLAADIAAAKYAKEHPEGPPMPFGQPGGKPTANGKTTNSKAPTKTTGPVKSKLPPQQRRSTAKDAAASNVKKRYRIVKTK